MYTGESSPRADVVSFARRSVPRARMALRRSAARAAAEDMMRVLVCGLGRGRRPRCVCVRVQSSFARCARTLSQTPTRLPRCTHRFPPLSALPRLSDPHVSHLADTHDPQRWRTSRTRPRPRDTQRCCVRCSRRRRTRCVLTVNGTVRVLVHSTRDIGS